MNNAAFNMTALQTIWGNNPLCLLSGHPASEFHHIKGRTATRLRWKKMHSSVFNAAPLCRQCHAWGAKTQPEIKTYLLRKVYNQIMESVQRLEYDLTEEDEKFIS